MTDVYTDLVLKAVTHNNAAQLQLLLEQAMQDKYHYIGFLNTAAILAQERHAFAALKVLRKMEVEFDKQGLFAHKSEKTGAHTRAHPIDWAHLTNLAVNNNNVMAVEFLCSNGLLNLVWDGTDAMPTGGASTDATIWHLVCEHLQQTQQKLPVEVIRIQCHRLGNGYWPLKTECDRRHCAQVFMETVTLYYAGGVEEGFKLDSIHRAFEKTNVPALMEQYALYVQPVLDANKA